MAGRRPQPPGIRRVEIAGGIASGKSTLARLLSSVGLNPVYEQFKKNPFFEAFYRDPSGTAFEAEITFLLQHYHLQRQAMQAARPFCADFSVVLDHSYAQVTLTPSDLRLFRGIQQRVEESLSPRTLLVVLVCPPRMQLQRIRRRRRSAESGISLKYLEKVDWSLKKNVAALPKSHRVLTIDSVALDFAHNARDVKHVLDVVKSAIA